LGKLPKMGYDDMFFSHTKLEYLLILCNSLQPFVCKYNRMSVLAQAEAMVKRGLVEAGYNVSE
jgi:hypothetical protein